MDGVESAFAYVLMPKLTRRMPEQLFPSGFSKEFNYFQVAAVGEQKPYHPIVSLKLAELSKGYEEFRALDE